MSTITSPTRAQSADAIQTFAPFIRWIPRVIALVWAGWCIFFANTLVSTINSTYPAEEFGYTPTWYYVAAAAAYIAILGAFVALRWSLAGGIVLVVSVIISEVANLVFSPEMDRHFGRATPAVDFFTAAYVLIAALLIGSALLLQRRRAVAP